jgi:hypothetical protein
MGGERKLAPSYFREQDGDEVFSLSKRLHDCTFLVVWTSPNGGLKVGHKIENEKN